MAELSESRVETPYFSCKICLQLHQRLYNYEQTQSIDYSMVTVKRNRRPYMLQGVIQEV